MKSETTEYLREAAEAENCVSAMQTEAEKCASNLRCELIILKHRYYVLADKHRAALREIERLQRESVKPFREGDCSHESNTDITYDIAD